MCARTCAHTYIYIYTHVYIYIYREREREKHACIHRDLYAPMSTHMCISMNTHIHVYIYIYIYISILIFRFCSASFADSARLGVPEWSSIASTLRKVAKHLVPAIALASKTMKQNEICYFWPVRCAVRHYWL